MPFVTVQCLSLKQSSICTTAASRMLLPICPGKHGIHACIASSCTLRSCLQVCGVKFLQETNFHRYSSLTQKLNATKILHTKYFCCKNFSIYIHAAHDNHSYMYALLLNRPHTVPLLTCTCTYSVESLAEIWNCSSSILFRVELKMVAQNLKHWAWQP